MRSYLYRLIKSLLIITTMVLASGGAIIAKPVVMLDFADSVTVNDTAIYMRDIAVVSTESQDLKRRILATVAGDIAPPGHSRFISTADLILYRLQPAFRDSDLKVLQNKRIVVKTAGISRKIGDYLDIVERYLSERIGWKQGEWSLSIENSEDTWKSLDLPLDVTVEGFAPEKTLLPRGHIQLQLNVKQRDRVVRVPVSCLIKIAAPVAIARHTVPRGKFIDSNDIELKRVDITNFGPDPYYKVADLQGQKAVRTISQGSIFFNRLLAPIPVVSKGDQIAISVAKGNVLISVMAIARENGGIGQKIWVENATTHRLVRVVIKDRTSAGIL